MRLVPLLEQAQHNLGQQAHIGTIVVERGYLDGEDLWRVHQTGVIFVICGKSTMTVTQDAQGIAKREQVIVRERVVRRGHGKTATEQRLSSALWGGEGIARWRKRLEEENRDKIIVFLGQAYGIFHLAEFAIVTHLPLRRLPSALGSPQAVLQHFGISP
jgi:hypothetical protein